MSASTKVAADNSVTQLDRSAQPDELVTEDDASDAPKLARLLGRVLKDVASLKRRWVPRRIDFEDRVCGTAGATLSLRHGFTGRVRWYVIGWSGATAAPALAESTTSDSTLVLQSYVAGTATIRVEEAG
jgi:hypothetical protein